MNKSEETKIESKKSQKQSLFKNVFRNPEFKKSKDGQGQVQPNVSQSSKIKQEPLEATAILKRTDGRPILICNIPLRYAQCGKMVNLLSLEFFRETDS